MARKLLVVDDDLDLNDILSTFGKKRGYEVSCAHRGDQALELAKSERPDVILLDVQLPGLDGRDVMAKLAESGMLEQTIVIFVTARDSQSDRLLGLELGAVEYEIKPLHYGRLFDKLDRLLDKKRVGEL